MTSIMDLRPNRRLLDHEFEGYKLNLQALPSWKHELLSPVDKVYPNEMQYSFLHAKLFAFHNHLVADYWGHHYTFYYVDKKQQVRRVNFNKVYHTFENSVVYDIPAHVERKAGHFNLCLTFPSISLAVVSDGTGYLHIVSTENRMNSNQMWKTLHSSLALGENKYFIIIDCKVQETEVLSVHCLLQSIEQNEKHFSSILTWITFSNSNNLWTQTSIRQLQGKGIIHYAALETSFLALYIVSDNQFRFISDSEYDISQPMKNEIMKKIIYTWLQTMEDITISLKLPNDYDKSLFHINVGPSSIKVSYAGNTFVDGKFQYKVDSELTTWNIREGGQVDILITKSESQLWSDLLQEADPSGEQIMDASLVEEAHKRLAHLCSETEIVADNSVPGLSSQQLEECDAASEEDTTLVRLDVSSHDITHRVPLSVHQYLFSINIEPNETPALALRHDVDTCIWQPYAKLPSTSTWHIRHQGTLMAFGYIQSSKQNRKFITCPPNFSYSVVCESSRHIFIYKNGEVENEICQLRQRIPNETAKRVKTGHQHVFNVDKFGEVLGINATNSCLFILTESSFIVLDVM